MNMINVLKGISFIFVLSVLFVSIFMGKPYAATEITSIKEEGDAVKIDADNPLEYIIDKVDPFITVVNVKNAYISNFQEKYEFENKNIRELKVVQEKDNKNSNVKILLALNTVADINTKKVGNSLYIMFAGSQNQNNNDNPKKGETKNENIIDFKDKKQDIKSLATEIIAVFLNKTEDGSEMIIKGNGMMPEPIVYRNDNTIIIELSNLELRAYLPSMKALIFPFKSIKAKKEISTVKFLIEVEKEVMLAYFKKDINVDYAVSVYEDEVILNLAESKGTYYKGKETTSKKFIQLKYKDGDIKNIFTRIAKDADYDYIIVGDINKTLTVEYSNITIQDAFALLEKEGKVKITIDHDSVSGRKIARLEQQEIISKKDDIPVSFYFQDADLAPVLLLLSEISGFNIILHPEIKDIKYKLTTDLKNVRWIKALERIVELFALSFSVDEENKIITVAPIETVNKIEKSRQELREARLREYKSEVDLYEIRNKISKEKFQALMSEKKITKIIKLKYIQAKTAVDIINRLNIFPGSIGQEIVTVSPTLTSDPQNPESVTKSATTPITSVSTSSKDIREVAEIGIAAYSANNEIVLRHVPSVIEEVEEFLKKIDSPFTTTQQILVEARIVEMSSNDARDLGVQWGVSGWGATKDGGILSFGGTRDARPAQSASDYATTPYSQVGIGQATQGTLGSTNIMPLIINMPAAVGQGAGGSFGIGYLNKAASLLLDFRLSALEKIGRSKILSNPRILTLNDSPAVIRHGARVPITTPGSTQGTFTTTYIDAALVLKVNPHIDISKENLVYLSISVNKDEPNYARTDNLGNPEISARQAYTKVALKDGETIVIGGLTMQRTDEGEDTVPGISKIPILGNLFKRNYKYNKTEELLIFITPRIIEQIKD